MRGVTSTRSRAARAVRRKSEPDRSPVAAGEAAAAPPAGVTRPTVDEWALASLARSLMLEEGLNLVVVGRAGAGVAAEAGFALPAVSIAAAPGAYRAPIEIVSAADAVPGWLDGEGGTVIVKVPPGGGGAVMTVYGLAADAPPPEVRVVNLRDLVPRDAGLRDPAALARALAPETTGGAGREVEAELLMHIEQQGDRRQLARGWVGNPGQPLRVEGFAVRPLAELNPGDVEYMGFGLAGRQTPWVSEAKLCGTRGRGLPLTGFAIRLAQGASERFDVIYEGYFFRSGLSGPVRNGEPCLPAMADDSLAAIRMRILERSGA
jgi:hypothetical protein